MFKIQKAVTLPRERREAGVGSRQGWQEISLEKSDGMLAHCRETIWLRAEGEWSLYSEDNRWSVVEWSLTAAEQSRGV